MTQWAILFVFLIIYTKLSELMIIDKTLTTTPYTTQTPPNWLLTCISVTVRKRWKLLCGHLTKTTSGCCLSQFGKWVRNRFSNITWDSSYGQTTISLPFTLIDFAIVLVHVTFVSFTIFACPKLRLNCVTKTKTKKKERKEDFTGKISLVHICNSILNGIK